MKFLFKQYEGKHICHNKTFQRPKPMSYSKRGLQWSHNIIRMIAHSLQIVTCSSNAATTGRTMNSIMGLLHFSPTQRRTGFVLHIGKSSLNEPILLFNTSKQSSYTSDWTITAKAVVRTPAVTKYSSVFNFLI